MTKTVNADMIGNKTSTRFCLLSRNDQKLSFKTTRRPAVTIKQEICYVVAKVDTLRTRDAKTHDEQAMDFVFHQGNPLSWASYMPHPASLSNKGLRNLHKAQDVL